MERSMRGRGDGSDAGQAVVFVVVAMFLAFGCLVVLGRVAQRAVDRAAAQTAADAAALAGVERGAQEAAAVARANGGQLTVFAQRDGVVEVVVEVGTASATARATRAVARSELPVPWDDTGIPDPES
jgi:hypothetical protein